MIVKIEVTRTSTGKIDTDKVTACWPDEYQEWRQREKVTDDTDETAVRFVQACANEIGGMELLDDFADEYDTSEETEVRR